MLLSHFYDTTLHFIIRVSKVKRKQGHQTIRVASIVIIFVFGADFFIAVATIGCPYSARPVNLRLKT